VRIAELDHPTVGKQVRLATETTQCEPYVDRMFGGAKAMKEDSHAFSYILDEPGNEQTLDLKPCDRLQKANAAIYAALTLVDPERFAGLLRRTPRFYR
jgi:hypothetical protein